MGKNQQHKALQQSKHAGGGAGDADAGGQGVDVSFHTAGAFPIECTNSKAVECYSKTHSAPPLSRPLQNGMPLGWLR